MATRRTFLKLTAAASLAAPSIASAQAAGRVVVVGGGFGGATAARTLKALEPKLTVTLVEPNPVFTACPFSNNVLAALREAGCRLEDMSIAPPDLETAFLSFMNDARHEPTRDGAA